MCRSIRGVLVLACVSLANLAVAQEQATTERVIVLEDGVQLYAGNEPIRELAAGRVLTVTQSQGDWRLVPRFRGWVRQAEVHSLGDALQHIDQLLSKNNTAVLHHYRGIVLGEMGRFPEALSSFQAAEDAGFKDGSLWINRGNALQKSGDREAAIEAFTRAIALTPTEAQAYDNRSCLLAELGELDRALQDSHKAIDLDPKSAEAWNNRGVVHRMKGDLASALRDYEEAIRLSPWYAAAYANRAYAYKQLAQFEAALHSYNLALKADPEFVGAKNDLAWLLATSPEDTIRDGQRAVQLATAACEQTQFQDWNFIDTLAAAYAEAGEFSKAIEWQSKLVQQSPADQKAAAERRLALFERRRPFRESVAPQPEKLD